MQKLEKISKIGSIIEIKNRYMNELMQKTKIPYETLENIISKTGVSILNLKNFIDLAFDTIQDHNLSILDVRVRHNSPDFLPEEYPEDEYFIEFKVDTPVDLLMELEEYYFNTLTAFDLVRDNIFITFDTLQES